MNADFEAELLKYLPREGIVEIFTRTIKDQYNSQTFSIVDDRKDYLKQIEDLVKKIDRGHGLLLDGHVEGGDFQVIKNDCNNRIEILEARINDLNVENAAVPNIEGLLLKAMRNIEQLDEFHDKSSVEGKRFLMTYCFSRKLTYESGTFRTLLMSEITQHIYLDKKGVREKKEGVQKIEVNPKSFCLTFGVHFNFGQELLHCSITIS